MPYIDPTIDLGNFNVAIFRTSGGVRIINLTQYNLIFNGEVISKPDVRLIEYLKSFVRTCKMGKLGDVIIYNDRLDSCKAERDGFLDQLFDSEGQYDYVIISNKLCKYIQLVLNLEYIPTSKFVTVSGTVVKPHYDDTFLVSAVHTICDEEVE